MSVFHITFVVVSYAWHVSTGRLGQERTAAELAVENVALTGVI